MECERVRESDRVLRSHRVVQAQLIARMRATLHSALSTSGEESEEKRRHERCILEPSQQQLQQRGETRRRHAAEPQTKQMKAALKERAQQKKREEEEQKAVMTTLGDLLESRKNEIEENLPLQMEKTILANMSRSHSMKTLSQRELDLALSKMQKALMDFHRYRQSLAEMNVNCRDELEKGAWADVVRKVKKAKEAHEMYEQHCMYFNTALAHLTDLHGLTTEQASGFVDNQLQRKRMEVDIQIQSAMEFLMEAKTEQEQRQKQKTPTQTVTTTTALIPFAVVFSIYILISEAYSVWQLIGVLMLSVIYFSCLPQIETIVRAWIPKCTTMAKSGMTKLKNMSVFLRIVDTAFENQNAAGSNNYAVIFIFILAATMWFVVIILVKLYYVGFFSKVLFGILH